VLFSRRRPVAALPLVGGPAEQLAEVLGAPGEAAEELEDCFDDAEAARLEAALRKSGAATRLRSSWSPTSRSSGRRQGSCKS
jgi:hypothetical protein